MQREGARLINPLITNSVMTFILCRFVPQEQTRTLAEQTSIGRREASAPRLSVGGFNSVGELTPTKSPTVKPGFRFGWLLVLALDAKRAAPVVV
jgi:hypothetical protein